MLTSAWNVSLDTAVLITREARYSMMLFLDQLVDGSASIRVYCSLKMGVLLHE